MKAMAYHDYGTPDVLKCEEVEIPRRIPSDETTTRVTALELRVSAELVGGCL
jgi:hypothetical protein